MRVPSPQRSTTTASPGTRPRRAKSRGSTWQRRWRPASGPPRCKMVRLCMEPSFVLVVLAFADQERDDRRDGDVEESVVDRALLAAGGVVGDLGGLVAGEGRALEGAVGQVVGVAALLLLGLGELVLAVVVDEDEGHGLIGVLGDVEAV